MWKKFWFDFSASISKNVLIITLKILSSGSHGT